MRHFASAAFWEAYNKLPEHIRALADKNFALLERDRFRLNRHRALHLWWSMIFSENRYPLFRIML
jgi:hypothetical protein